MCVVYVGHDGAERTHTRNASSREGKVFHPLRLLRPRQAANDKTSARSALCRRRCATFVFRGCDFRAPFDILPSPSGETLCPHPRRYAIAFALRSRRLVPLDLL